MKNFKLFISILLLFISQSNILCQDEPEKISIGDSKELSLTKDNSFNSFFVLEYTEQDLSNGDILVISSTPDSYLTPGYIYSSFEETKPSADKRQFSSQNLGKNSLFISTSKLKEQSKLYINIHSLQESKIKLELNLKKEIYISPDEKKVSFKLSDLTQVYFFPKDITSNKILFYALGENVNYFTMKVEYSGDAQKEFAVVQKYENGYGAIVDLTDLQGKDTEKFTISLSPAENYKEKNVEVGFDFVDQNDDNKIQVEILEHVHGATSAGINCYQIKDFKSSKKATMLLNIYTQSITFSLMNNATKKYSLDVFNNYFIKLPKEYDNAEDYFCFKKFTPKEKEQEELGEVSYDFQIYYEEDLTSVQSFIMPLINGKVYTHSLNSGDIFIYRHNSFSNKNTENKIYSANLLSIRGKPHMYGYPCKTFPECNLDEEKFNDLKTKNELDVLKPISQYYVNKKLNALGNTENNANGDPVSDAREQYLTIVKCESSTEYPNYGECKFSIEINNELDEVQLAPEIVYPTSLVSPKNYFNIRVTDFKNIKYLNIFFTVLTGNADIYLYEDKNYQNLLTKYNYRHAHRKEVIEITEDFKENYYIEIRTTDNSFVELKYETDFYNRGYTRMNPNEINIEYVNQKNGFVPFEIHNPDYFYPLDNPYNNDFYFTVRSLDCGMTYKYNFQDFENITSVHYEVEKDDINFGSSFAFMLKVESYFHTPKDDTEDCTMIVYTGEKSQNTPLLLISDMPHPSNFTETYYLYPFIYNKDFNGIFVDIKFEYELLIEEESPSLQVTFKIGEQKEDFTTYTIKNDYTFFIKNEAEKYCTNNLQCTLTIEIKKIFKDNKTISPYYFKTNVYNAVKSPEYIFKKKVYNYKLSPSHSKYFYSQVDLNEEGELNIMFNKGNGKIFAKLVEKTKIEENFNWNKRVKLPEPDDQNLLNYDPIYGVIKYSAENTKVCEKGCELYIQIKSEDKTNKETDFTEVSLILNDKKVNFVDMRLNNYINGYLERDQYKYYSILIPEDYMKVSINLYSPYGKAYVKLGNGTVATKDNFDWEINPTNDFGRIVISCKDEKINKDSLKGVGFTIGIINSENLPAGELNNYLYYNLEVQTLFNNDKIYYQLTRGRSIVCNTENDNYCHVLLYLNHYYSNKNNLLYVLPLSNNTANIYAKFYSQKDIEEKLLSDSIQSLFPTSDDYTQSSGGKQILLLNPEKISELNDNYVLLTVDVGAKNIAVKVLFNGADVAQTLLPSNDKTLLVLKENSNNLLLPNKDKYILNLKALEGNAILNVNKENYNIKGNHYIELEANDEGFKVENDKAKSDETVLLVSYEKKSANRAYELYMNDKNEINLPLTEEVFPQYVYTKLNSAEQLEFYFDGIEYKTRNNDYDLFDINAYVVNEKRIKSLIINPVKEIQGEKLGYYLKYEKTGVVTIPSDKIKVDDTYYIYLVVDKNGNNTNTYNKIKTQYSIVNKEEEAQNVLYPNKHYFSSLSIPSSSDYYLLKKESIDDKYILIDISENIPVNDNFVAIVNLYPENKNNNTQILDYNGRRRVIVDLQGQEGVKLWVTKNQLGNETSKNYSVIYYSLSDLNKFDNYTNFNNSIIVGVDGKKSKILINNIKNEYDYIKEVIYHVDIFKVIWDVDKFKYINTIYLGNHDEKAIEYSKEVKSDEKEIKIDIDFTIENKTEYAVRIVADILKNDGSYDKYMYNSTLLDFSEEKKDEKDDDDESSSYVWLFILIPVFIIFALIVFVLILKRRRAKIPEKEVNEIDNSRLMQEKPAED